MFTSVLFIGVLHNTTKMPCFKYSNCLLYISFTIPFENFCFVATNRISHKQQEIR